MQPTSKRQQRLAKMKAKGSVGFEPEVEEDIKPVELKDTKESDKDVIVGSGLKWDESCYIPDAKFLPKLTYNNDPKLAEQIKAELENCFMIEESLPVTIQLGGLILFKGTMEELGAKRDKDGVIQLCLPSVSTVGADFDGNYYNAIVGTKIKYSDTKLITKPDSGEK